MIRSKALVDYEKFRCAEVAIFLDITDANRTFRLIAKHHETIKQIAELFDARILMIDQKKLQPEMVLENEIADAWILLVSSGHNRAMTTKKNPQRINVDTPNDWGGYAFKELIRQIKESNAILEDVTTYYSRYTLQENRNNVPGTASPS